MVKGYLCLDPTKVLIRDIVDLTLSRILFTLIYISIYSTPHLASKFHMDISLQCIELTIFNWCDVLLTNMMDKLTRC